jgi:hypothetical protein
VGGIHSGVKHRYDLTASGEPICPHGRSLNQRGALGQVGGVEIVRRGLVQVGLVQTILYYVGGTWGALDGLKRLRGNLQGDERDRFVFAQRLISAPSQILSELRLGASYLVALIRNFGPTEPPFGYEFGPKSYDHPNGSLPLGLLK